MQNLSCRSARCAGPGPAGHLDAPLQIGPAAHSATRASPSLGPRRFSGPAQAKAKRGRAVEWAVASMGGGASKWPAGPGFRQREERTERCCIERLCFGDFHLGPQMKVTRPPGRDPASNAHDAHPLPDPQLQQPDAAPVPGADRARPRGVGRVRHLGFGDDRGGRVVSAGAHRRAVPEARDSRGRLARHGVPRRASRHRRRPRAVGARLGDRRWRARMGRHGAAGHRRDGRRPGVGGRDLRDARGDQVEPVPQRGHRGRRARGGRGGASASRPTAPRLHARRTRAAARRAAAGGH